MGGGGDMANAQEIRKQLEKLFSYDLSLDEFEDWLARYSWNIHKSGDEAAQKLAYAIEHQLSIFDDDNSELREALYRVYASASANNLSSDVVPQAR
jgi:hypothetical protein